MTGSAQLCQLRSGNKTLMVRVRRIELVLPVVRVLFERPHNDTCTSCSGANYASGTGNTSCSPWLTCGQGEYRLNGSASANATCTNCPSNTYQSSSSNAGGVGSCDPCLTSCANGQTISGYCSAGSTSINSCSTCGSGTYDHDSDHNTSCDSCMSSCNNGSTLTACTATSTPTCVTCSSGTTIMTIIIPQLVCPVLQVVAMVTP